MPPIYAIVKIIKPSKQLTSNYLSKVHAVNMCPSLVGSGRSLRLITMNCDHITVNCNTQSITPPPPRLLQCMFTAGCCSAARVTGSLATGPNTLVLCRGGDDRNHGEERNHRGSPSFLVATIVALSQVGLQTNLCEV